MTTKHTPRPWTLTAHPCLPIGNIHHGPHQPGEVSVCAVSLRGNGTDEANARLLVAAPDLLAALRGIVDWKDAECTWGDAIAAARAAIAKAEEG